MSQTVSPANRHAPDERLSFGAAVRFALPSWLVSLALHTLLLGSFATVTWTITRAAPEETLPVGIMVKRQTADGPVLEDQSRTYTARDEPAMDATQFLPDATPADLAAALPQLPPVDLSTIGVSGSMITGTGQMLAIPDAGGPSGITASTQFFGAQVWGNRFVYVIDRSGSMTQRDALGAAKRELVASLERLPAAAQFQVIFYNLQPTVMPIGHGPARLLYATDANKKLAQRYLDTVVADGGTEHVPAVKAAIGLGSDVIFLLTDADDMAARDVQELTQFNKGRAAIHTIEFGIGPSLDSKTALRDLAAANGGTYRYVDVDKLGRGAGGGPR